MFESSSNIEPDNDRLGNEIPIPNSNIYWFPSSCWNVIPLNNPASWGLFWSLSIPTSYSPHGPRHYLMQGPKSGSPSAMSPVEIWNSCVEDINFGVSCSRFFSGSSRYKMPPKIHKPPEESLSLTCLLYSMKRCSTDGIDSTRRIGWLSP